MKAKVPDGFREYFFFENLRYDITGLKRMIRNNRQRLEVYRPDIDDGLIHHLSMYVEPDEAHILALTPEQLEEPCIAINRDDGMRIIDGFHRIRRRHRDGFKDFPTYLFTEPEIFDYIRRAPPGIGWTALGNKK